MVGSAVANVMPNRRDTTIHARTATTHHAPAQATPASSRPLPELSRFDLYGGYGYINPGSSHIGPDVYQPIHQGAVVSATAYFNRYLGVQAEGSIFPDGPNDCINSIQAGEKAAQTQVAGKGNIVDVVNSVNQAELTLDTVVAVRDKVVAAYQSIMNMAI